MTIRLTDQKIDDMVHRIMLRQESSISPNDLMSALKELQGWRRFDSVTRTPTNNSWIEPIIPGVNEMGD